MEAAARDITREIRRDEFAVCAVAEDQVVARVKDGKRALDALERAVSLGISPQYLRDTPNFDALRDHPRFVALIQTQKNN